MMALGGPFQVDPEDLERLGSAFTQYVNDLLVREGARAQLLGYQVHVDSQDNTPDGGVDAALDSRCATSWIAKGQSCWQFKRGDLGPQACAEELEKASWAQDLVKNGATYTIILGRRLGDQKINARRSALFKKAQELGLVQLGEEDRIQVLDANALARWIGEFPSLAVSPLLGAPSYGVTDYGTWSASNRHISQWIPNQERVTGIQTIRDAIATASFSEIRITGESGVGKTRLVMEALRDDPLSPLVVYLPNQQAVTGDVLGYLLTQSRTAILVVDDCSGHGHEKLAEQVPEGAALRLVTIGELDGYAIRAPVLALSTMAPEEIAAFLTPNFPQLSAEAVRFIGDQCLGNARFAIMLAQRIREGGAVAADLISRGDAEQLVQALFPEGRPFFLAAVLALVERVGWEGELAAQLSPLAVFAGATEDEMRAVARDLEERGLLNRQGRYRAVGPHPVAIVLAANAWRSEGRRIVDELLPSLDRDMSLSLFTRVAALGRFEPARQVLRQLMSESGLFGSLASIEENEAGRFLTQLAIVAPEETMRHLGALLESAELEELRQTGGSRRDLVWTLEKLAWHRQTFPQAANGLLRLALAENETWANNATGVWIALFGTLLPGTAATPAERITYLTAVAEDAESEKRLLAIKGASRALAHHESISVSAELQGGSLVEPRGRPSTWDEAGDYRRATMGILERLSSDHESEVAAAAADVLISAVHPLIDDPFVGDDLISALTRLPPERLVQLRRDIEHLVSLHERHPMDERGGLVDRLRVLSDALPQATEQEQIRVLLNLRPWDLGDEQLRMRLTKRIQELSADDREWLLELLRTEALPASWELGAALGRANVEDEELEGVLVDAFAVNPNALIGYLRGLVEQGDAIAFDRFLDGSLADRIDSRDKLVLASRGPATDHAKQRILALAREIPVGQGASTLFGWQQNLTDRELAEIVGDWSGRLESQQDYNALVDWINLWRTGSDPLPEILRQPALEIVMMRSAFPDMGQQAWDWAQLANAFVDDHAEALTRLILDLIANDRLMVHRDSYESQMLVAAVKARPAEIWPEIAERLLSGSWRIQMEIRGWLLAAIPSSVVEKWIGTDVERARLVASITPVGGDEPLSVVRLLLEQFGSDEEVASNLRSEFVSGSWMGPYSQRLEGQISQLNAWVSRATEPEGVQRWAREMIGYLEVRREQALEEEAERGF